MDGAHRTSALAFLAIDTDSNEAESETNLLGTDLMFFFAFIGKHICLP